MIARIAGMGWVTPLGTDLADVSQRIAAGEQAEVKALPNPESGRAHSFVPVPPKLVDSLGRNPRLRRSSAISYFAVAAGLAALENAGLALSPELAAGTAIVFAITDGGVQYTRRFYDQIVKQGANAASPMLFPETVYNAPASHLAAQLGIDGASYTLVGDQSVGLAALHFAAQLLATNSEVERCIVVGAEECDWVLCEGYDAWRLARTPLAEGAAALVLAREGRLALETHPGRSFFRQKDAACALERSAVELLAGRSVDLAVTSANRTFVDRAEAAVLAKLCPTARQLAPKRSLGEAPGASALIQTVLAAHAVERGEATQALVPVVGFNDQAAAALVGR